MPSLHDEFIRVVREAYGDRGSYEDYFRNLQIHIHRYLPDDIAISIDPVLGVNLPNTPPISVVTITDPPVTDREKDLIGLYFVEDTKVTIAYKPDGMEGESTEAETVSSNTGVAGRAIAMMILRHVKTRKRRNWSVTEGVELPARLYHATEPTRVFSILKSGLSTGHPSRFGSEDQQGVSVATEFDAVSDGKFGNAILVLDPQKISTEKFDFIPTDYWGDDSEKEIRIVSKTGDAIPADAVVELIRITPSLARYELEDLQQGTTVPVRTFWKGKLTDVSVDRENPVTELPDLEGIQKRPRRTESVDPGNIMSEFVREYQDLDCINEFAAARVTDKAKTYYHGTPMSEFAKSIFVNGIHPPDLTGRSDNLRPREGKVYITPEIKYSLVYALGGSVAGGGADTVKHMLDHVGRYGYLFVIPGERVSDIEPDEDSIGEMIYDGTPEWLHELASEQLEGVEYGDYEDDTDEYGGLGVDLFYDVMGGEYEAWAVAGKMLLPILSDEQKLSLIDNGAHVAHSGKLIPSECWRIDRKQIPDLKEDGSNFFDVAVKVTSVQEILDESRSSRSEDLHRISESKEVYYHGTSSVLAKKILSQGFIPDPKQKTWDQDTGDLESYYGTYFTKNFQTAYSSAGETGRKFGGSVVVFECQIETRTAHFDEDELPKVKTILSSCNLSPRAVEKLFKYNQEDYPAYVQIGVDAWFESLKRRMGRDGVVGLTDQQRKALEPDVYELIDKSLQIWMEDEQYPYTSHYPETKEIETRISDKLRAVARATAPGQKSLGITNVRMSEPIAFKGANKILGAVEFPDIGSGKKMIDWNKDTEQWEPGSNPPRAVVLYGTVSDRLINDWVIAQAGEAHKDDARYEVVT